MLCDLHRVERGALTQLVAADEERESVVERRVLADTANEAFILSSGLEGGRIWGETPIFADDDPRRGKKDLGGSICRYRLLELCAHRYRMGAEHRHTDAGHARFESKMMHDFPSLARHLLLLPRVAARHQGVDERKNIERYLMREKIDGRHFVICPCDRLFPELTYASRTGT